MAFIDNTMNVDLALLLVHPEADSSVTANRLFWIEVPSDRVINYDVGSAPGINFDPGTKIFVYRVGGAAAAQGKLRIAVWG
jgi:hypothetical protein